jgi:drug/metabolite transporter (DMT)-like permease
MPYSGEIAALLTAFCWSASALFFTWSGRRIGSQAVNLARLVAALALVTLLHLALFRTPFPFHAGTERYLYLGASGLIGFSLGDAVLFESFILLGPRLALLIMTLSPVFSAFLGRIFLHQALGWPKLLAILITLAGIAWVVWEHSSAADRHRPRHLFLGICLAVGGALGQSGGLLFSRFGLEGGFNPLSANLLRLTAATAGLMLWHLLRGDLLALFGRLRDRGAAMQVLGGATFGPVLGVTFSLFAIAHASMGVAATLMSLSPVILLPLSVFLDKEKITLGAVLGTLLSIAGCAALFIL